MLCFFFHHSNTVITLGKNFGKESLLKDPNQYAKLGIEIIQTNRGGSATIHGPGQLMIYPVMDLTVFNFMPRNYVDFLCCSIITLLDHFNISGFADQHYPGIWIDQSINHKTTQNTIKSKICALGIAFTKHITQHGLCLNVDCNLDNFNLITPCGINDPNRKVTSIIHQLKNTDMSDKLKYKTLDDFITQLSLCYTNVFCDLLAKKLSTDEISITHFSYNNFLQDLKKNGVIQSKSYLFN